MQGAEALNPLMPLTGALGIRSLGLGAMLNIAGVLLSIAYIYCIYPVWGWGIKPIEKEEHLGSGH